MAAQKGSIEDGRERNTWGVGPAMRRGETIVDARRPRSPPSMRTPSSPLCVPPGRSVVESYEHKHAAPWLVIGMWTNGFESREMVDGGAERDRRASSTRPSTARLAARLVCRCVRRFFLYIGYDVTSRSTRTCYRAAQVTICIPFFPSAAHAHPRYTLCYEGIIDAKSRIVVTPSSAPTQTFVPKYA
jgi:hypothetical protein